jgi:hypothetical protein
MRYVLFGNKQKIDFNISLFDTKIIALFVVITINSYQYLTRPILKYQFDYYSHPQWSMKRQASHTTHLRTGASQGEERKAINNLV